MIKKSLRFGTITILIFAIVLFSSCSDKSVEPKHESYPYSDLLDNVSFVPSEGPPGTIVNIQGLNSLPVDTGFSLLIGDQPTPLVQDIDGIKTVIPIYIDTTPSSWPMPPVGLQTVTLIYNNQPVDSVPDAILVDSLISAPHASDSIITDLTLGIEALKQIAQTIGIEDTLLLATCDAMNELLNTGEYSFAALIDGSSPVAGYNSNYIAVFQALLASSGITDMISMWSDTLQITAKVMIGETSALSSSSFLTDQMLADRMQLHDFLKGFGSEVVTETKLSWQTISALIGGVAIAKPALGVINGYEFIVGWTLGFLDFVINKIAVAMLPSDITDLELDFLDYDILVGDTTQAIIYISAENDPPNITPADIIGQVLGGLQLSQWLKGISNDPNASRTITNILKEIANWALGVITTVLSNNYNNPTSLDVALPHQTWDSVNVWHHNMVDLVSPEIGKISYIENSFNGTAGDELGDANLQVRIQPSGLTSYLNSTLAALGYAGGPFGDDFDTSNTEIVNIVADLVVEASLPSPINPDGAGVLSVMAGHKRSDGSIDYKPGIDISLSLIGGTTDNLTGTTNSNGQFTAVIWPIEGTDEIIVTVTATDSIGGVNSVEIRADIISDCEAAALTSSVTYVLGNLEYYALFDCNPDQNAFWLTFTVLNSYWAGATPVDLFVSGDTFDEQVGGPPQGFHGELFYEVKALCTWNQGICPEVDAYYYDTVSVIIP